MAPGARRPAPHIAPSPAAPVQRPLPHALQRMPAAILPATAGARSLPVPPVAAHVQRAVGGPREIQAKTVGGRPAGGPVPPSRPPVAQAKAPPSRIIPLSPPGRVALPPTPAAARLPAPPLRLPPTGQGGEPVVQPFLGMLGLTALGGALGYNVAGAAATTLATTLYTAVGTAGGWAAGWLAEEAYARWYGPTVAIVTITGFDLDSSLLDLMSKDDVIIRNNYKRLRTRYPHSKLIKLNDLDPQPIPAETLRGVETVNIIGHGEDSLGTVGMLDVDTLYKVLGKNIVAQLGTVNGMEEKKRLLRSLWRIREINLVSCNSASSRGGAENIASRLATKLQSLSRMLGFNIVVRGVDGFATVSDNGNVLSVPRAQYGRWTGDLTDLQKEARRSRLSLAEVRRRNQGLLDTYTTGVQNDFVAYNTQ